MIAFNTETHTYTLDGRVVPHVTEIIRTVCGSGWRADEFYLQRGRATHHDIRLMLEGRLDWATVDERIVGRVRAAGRFVEEAHLSGMSMNECVVASSRLLYAGTLDVIVVGRRVTTVVDWKGSLDPRNELQLAAYALAFEENPPAPITQRLVDHGIAVELHDDGTYQSQTYDLKRAKQVWLSVLTVYGWMTKNGVKNNGHDQYAR